MKRRLLIHIGAHKTATTSIQFRLDGHRAAFAQAGILYPLACTALQGHHVLAGALKEFGRDTTPRVEQKVARLLQDLRDEVDAADPRQLVLLSSEEFFTAPENGLRLLRDRFADFDVSILGYVRRQDGALISWYNELVKRLRNDFTRPVEEFVGAPLDLDAELNYVEFLDRWAGVFGEKRLEVRDYDAVRDVAGEFFAALGSGMPGADTPARKNPSVNLEVQEVLRLGKRVTRDVEVRKSLVVEAKRFFREGTPPDRLLSLAQRRRVLEYFAPANERLFARYFGAANRYAPERLNAPDLPPFALENQVLMDFMMAFRSARGDL